MKILRNFVVTGGLHRSDGSEAQVGDSVRLYPYDGDPFIGVIKNPISPFNCGVDRSYIIEYDLDILIRPCDLQDTGEVLDCCALLNEKIDNLNYLSVPDLIGGNDDTALVFGREYLNPFFNKLSSLSFTLPQFKFLVSGDSTTAGDSIANSNNILDNAIKRILMSQGIPSILHLNAGHSGATTADWKNNYVSVDMLSQPDLYILRWGLNDPSIGDAELFETNLRDGLTIARNSFGVEDMAIVLMTPNSTNDTPNGRDEAWHRLINPIIRKAARDFSCCFIDTFSIWPDVSHAAGVWMDNPYSDGRAIHPLDSFNIAIAGVICDVIYPVGLRSQGWTGLDSVWSGESVANASFLPNSYRRSKLQRATTGFPKDGSVLTLASVDTIALQLNWDYNTSALSIRTGFNTNWNSWVSVNTTSV